MYQQQSHMPQQAQFAAGAGQGFKKPGQVVGGGHALQ